MYLFYLFIFLKGDYIVVKFYASHIKKVALKRRNKTESVKKPEQPKTKQDIKRVFGIIGIPMNKNPTHKVCTNYIYTIYNFSPASVHINKHDTNTITHI